MNIYVKAKEYTSAQDMIADYKARQSLTRNSQGADNTIRSLKQQNAELRAALEQSKADCLGFAKALRDAQEISAAQAIEMQRLHATLANIQAQELSEMDDVLPARKIIEETLLVFPDVSVSEVLGPRRLRRIVAARHACITAIYTRRPDLSSTQVAAIFKRDHTTILYAVGATARSGRALDALGEVAP